MFCAVVASAQIITIPFGTTQPTLTPAWLDPTYSSAAYWNMAQAWQAVNTNLATLQSEIVATGTGSTNYANTLSRNATNEARVRLPYVTITNTAMLGDYGASTTRSYTNTTGYRATFIINCDYGESEGGSGRGGFSIQNITTGEATRLYVVQSEGVASIECQNQAVVSVSPNDIVHVSTLDDAADTSPGTVLSCYTKY